MEERAKRYSMVLRWSDEDQVYVVSVPELPGCMTDGRTREEAVRQGQDAIETWLDGEREEDIPLPHTYRVNVEVA